MQPSNCVRQEAFPSDTSTFDPAIYAPPVRLPAFPWSNAAIEQTQSAEDVTDREAGSSDSCQSSRREGSPFPELVSTTEDESDGESETSAPSREISRETRTMDVEFASPGSVPTLSFPADTVPESISSTEQARQLEITPAPSYSPHLPPVDPTKSGEDFYADLYRKRIIPGYDQDRFSCWCYVAKRAQNPRKKMMLSNSHCVPSTARNCVYRFQVRKWFGHAARCAFFKVSFRHVSKPSC